MPPTQHVFGTQPMAHFLLQTKHVPVDASPKKHWVCDHACPSLHRGPESRNRQLLVSSRSQANLHYPRNSAKTSRVLSLAQWGWWVLDQRKTSQNKRYDSNTKAQLNCLFCFHKLIESSVNGVNFQVGPTEPSMMKDAYDMIRVVQNYYYGHMKNALFSTRYNRCHESLLDMILSQKNYPSEISYNIFLGEW